MVKPDENVSTLQAIKANPSKPSVDAMLTLVGKLKVIEATGVLGIDLSWLNSNYQRALFHQVRRSSVTRLRELAGPRRRAALICFLWQSYRDAVDQAVDMFDKLLIRAQTQAQNELDEQLPSAPDHPGLVGSVEVSKPHHPLSIPDDELRTPTLRHRAARRVSGLRERNRRVGDRQAQRPFSWHRGGMECCASFRRPSSTP